MMVKKEQTLDVDFSQQSILYQPNVSATDADW